MSGFDFGKGPAKREPNADMRVVARAIREFYVAVKDEGFNSAQALQLTMKFLETSMRGGMEQNGDG